MNDKSASPTIDPQQRFAPVEQVERYMRAYLESATLPHNLVDAMTYSLLGPGKRMRPILVVRSCQAVGGTTDDALAPAAAIEMVHCFSLIHDDLPAMDDDDLRRGRPTLHRHTNEAMAILAGDALFGEAFELLTSRVASAERAIRLVRELSTGADAMIAGQVYDTLGEFEEGQSDAERLRIIHNHKTGALIRSAVRMGAICGGADEPQLADLTRYAEAIGLMFQVVDDLLDVTQTTEHLGKTAGKDIAQHKLTYPAVYGVEPSRREIERLRDVSRAALQSFGPDAQPLRDLCDYLAVRTR